MGDQDQQQWQRGRLIGDGTFGSVYVGLNPETGAVCAFKEIQFLQYDPILIQEHITQLAQEIRNLCRLRHPNILGYYHSEIVNDRSLCVYMEYAHHGSITKYMLEHGPVPEPVLRVFTRQIVSGLAYLHSKNVMHRDIKGANLFIDPSGVVKIADFGMARHLLGLVGGGGVSSIRGMLHWMAPEMMEAVLQRDLCEVTLAVDVWSLGCVVVEMFTGKPPWSEYESCAAIFKIMRTRSSPRIPGMLSDEGKDFLGCCFSRNPAERSSAAMLLEHPFLRN